MMLYRQSYSFDAVFLRSFMFVRYVLTGHTFKGDKCSECSIAVIILSGGAYKLQIEYSWIQFRHKRNGINCMAKNCSKNGGQFVDIGVAS